jgi:uncharacterized protein (DUF433 family)
MSELPTTVVIPLVTEADGTIRVRDSRVTLDAILIAFKAGATAEGISQKFPGIALADVYQIIAHYLNYAQEIDSYLARREAAAAVLQSTVEDAADPRGIRVRLLARLGR